MTNRTRYFVIASLLVLTVGLGTGLVAYYSGFPGGIFSRQDALDDLQLLPRDANLVAFANVHDVMASELRQKVRSILPVAGDGQREIAEQTGINIETDVDQIIACLASPQGDQRLPAAGLVLARGRFDDAKIEALMRDRGANVEDYKGTRLLVASHESNPSDSFALAFIEPGLAALGSTPLVRAAVDQRDGDPGVTANAELMSLLRSFQGGDAWAVGRFDTLASRAPLPAGLASQLPPITWVAASAEVDGGLRGTLRADTRDQEAGDNLREVVRGFIALVRLQAASQPDLKMFADSVVLGGGGSTVSLSFDAPGQLVDVLGSMVKRPQNNPQIPRK